MMIRRVDDEWLWARILHKIFPNQRSTPSVFELPRPAYAKRAYYIRIGVSVDDDSCIWFGWRVHGKSFEGGDPSLNGWRTCCMGGQSGKKPTRPRNAPQAISRRRVASGGYQSL